MHPLLTSRLRLVVYLGLWVGFAGLLALALAAPGVTWRQAFSFALPLGIVWGFVCLTAFYLCHAVPLRLGTWARIAGTHMGTATLSGAAWLALGWGLAPLALPPAAAVVLRDEYRRVAPALFVVSVLLFLLSSAIHYGLAALDTSRHAERRALEFELLSRDAELKTLRAQIHPHFLFNSLNSINALIARDPEGARRLCVLLADFLRGSLSLGGRPRIPIEQELEMAERLLAIEKVRFGARLEVVASIEEAVKGCLVPPMILQPLVENAITHGIAHLLDGGCVTLKAQSAPDRVEIVVANPRDPDTPPRHGTGLGLANVRQRLAALYGQDASIDVHADREAFRVRLRVPRETLDRPPQ